MYKYLKKVTEATAVSVFFVLIVASSLHPSPVFAQGAKPEKGETEIGFYFESSLFRDRSIGWTGSETSFQMRVKGDITHSLYDDILFRMKGEYSPTVNDHTINPGELKEREANWEDVYAKFSNLLGHASELRTGIVKVPFGHFNTMAFDDRNRPASFYRTREWDYGLRYDMWRGKIGTSFAIINGDGRNGTDANSAKSVALRVFYTTIPDDVIYPETLEVTSYPNPRVTNPGKKLSWRLGVSGYAGNRYSTPIKEKNNHYGVDGELVFSVFAIKAQYTYMEGGFTDRAEALGANLSGYTSAVTKDIDTFEKGYSLITELSAGISEKTMLTLMVESYDPDTESDATDKQKTKTRIVAGVKHDFRPGATVAMFYTMNDNPAFDETRNNDRGDDVLMLGVALQF